MSEISSENLGLLERRFRTTVYVVLAQIFVVLILSVAALGIRPGPDQMAEDADYSTFWIALLFLAVGSFLLRRVLFNWERLKNTAILQGVDGVLRTLQRNSLMLGALGLLIAGLGFFIALRSGSGFDMVRAGLVSLIVLIANFPRKGLWRAVVSHLQNVQK
jgi:hypothetical protein